jgi:glycosyltransferase involved in cell wall biosynthesis
VHVVLVDLERSWRGGQSQALLLLRGLQARGHAVELVAAGGGALAEHAQTAGITLHTTPKTMRRWGAARILRRLLREKRFDIIHANEPHALTAAWLGRAHRHAPLVAARRVTFPLSHGYLSLARYRAACIVAVSEAVREQLLAAHLDPERVVIVADGVEVPPLLTAEQRFAARQCWNFAANERVLAFVAPFTAEKGHALLLEAFSVLCQEMSNCRLLLAGDGPLRPGLEEQARTARLIPDVRFAGFVEEIGSVYAACDLFLFPSFSEGAGTSLLSAMAYALPVVALARGGVTEIVQEGVNGLLVQEASPAALAAAAARLLADGALARKFGAAGRETILARFSADHMVEATLAVFERLVDGTAGGG